MMMLSEGQVLLRLKEIRNLETQAKVVEFDRLMEWLNLNRNTLMEVPELYSIFIDECVNEEVQFGLLHFLESFNLEAYFLSLTLAFNRLSVSAPEWARTIACRILNNQTYREYLSSMDGDIRKDLYPILLELEKSDSTVLSQRAKEVISKWN